MKIQPCIEINMKSTYLMIDSTTLVQKQQNNR